MPVTITRRNRGGFAVAAVVALALSACSPSNGSDEPSTSSSGSPSAGSSSAVAGGSATASASKSASPTPVPASSKGPAKNWPVPKMPEAAKKKTSEGLKAFSEYYFELLTYTTITNDTEALEKATSKFCDLCADGFIDPATTNRQNKTWAVGGEYDARVQSSQMVGDKSGTAVWQYERRKATYYNSDGSVYGVSNASKKPTGGTFSATYDHGWKITEISTVKS